MNRRDCIRAIQDRLENRQLVFFGTRGADAETLLDIAQLRMIFSQVAPLNAISVQETCLEHLTGERVDLNSYNIDYDKREAVKEIQAKLLESFDKPSAVIPYRPCALLTSAWFPRSNRVWYLSVFHEKQSYLEHKPWVESELKALGVHILPWRYYSDVEFSLIREAVGKTPLVLRANRSDGGAGISLIRGIEELEEKWPAHVDGFLAAAPFLSPTIPLNIGACVFPDGHITLHPASFQIIGPKECTTRTFGYCGNDFAAVKVFDKENLDKLQNMTILVGQWMYKNGYIGAFGIDFLIYQGDLYLTEVNPRFQGSSLISAIIDREMGRPDIFLDHISAFLGLPCSDQITLCDLTREQQSIAHVIYHNIQPEPITVTPVVLDALPLQIRLVPEGKVQLLPEAIIFEVILRRSVTENGLNLFPDAKLILEPIAHSICGKAANKS